MKLTSLSLLNLRSFEFAEFSFNPQFNLIAGINGAGKSTVLDAVRTCSSHIVRHATGVRINPFSFERNDIHFDKLLADATLHFTLDEKECRFTLKEWRDVVARDNPANIDRLRREILETERPNERLRNLLRDLADTLTTPEPTLFIPPTDQIRELAKSSKSAPLVIHFSTKRSWMRDYEASDSKAAANAPAYFNALRNARLSVTETAERLRAQRELALEHEPSRRALKALNDAVATFLPDFSNLRPSEDGSSRVLIDHDGGTLDIRQLSDGERSVLVLILDIARRLTLANPKLENPLRDAEAVILIDEIDLHLHPNWQRKIVGDLTKTFPSCQFIATTHSPQVIGEVAHEHIQIIDGDNVYSPDHSFGVDSSRVLEELMDTKPRNAAVDEKLNKVSALIDEGKEDEAKGLIDKLAREIGDSDPEITRARLLIDFMNEDSE